MNDAAQFLQRALDLARKGEGHTRPNPPVGAVVVKAGKIIGEGWHRRVGGDHAEVAAIKSVRRRFGAKADSLLSGASLYVTLEPCSKPGRVGACTDAIAAAKIASVVYAADDPNPTNRGKAKRALAHAGISCARYRHPEKTDPFAELIRSFAKHIATGRPFVTVKLALSADGRIADDFGDARWISSAGSRRETGRLRERVDAIMVGAETIRRDNPSLLSHGRRNDDLWRVVISRSGRLPASAQVFTDAAKARTLVYADPASALDDLGRRGFLHVLCEGGLSLARSLASEGLVDRWLAVLAPVVIGSGHLADATRGRFEPASCALRHGDGFFSILMDAPRPNRRNDQVKIRP